MPRPPLEALRGEAFRKSTFSDPQQSCVEIAHAPDVFGVRDSKQADSPVLAVSRATGRAFIHHLRGGHFAE